MTYQTGNLDGFVVTRMISSKAFPPKNRDQLFIDIPVNANDKALEIAHQVLAKSGRKKWA